VRASDESPPPGQPPAAQNPTAKTAAPVSLTPPLFSQRWTGWPQAQIAGLEPTDIRWDDAVRVKPRRKGRGAASIWLPLLPQAWNALREFKRLGCWGAFSTSSARTSFRLAARKARRVVAAARAAQDGPARAEGRRLRRELLDITPYQLRHSFLTLVAAFTQDDRAVQTLAQHADIRTTHRYTGATVDPRALAAVLKVGKQLESIVDGQN
jgi:integrase